MVLNFIMLKCFKSFPNLVCKKKGLPWTKNKLIVVIENKSGNKTTNKIIEEIISIKRLID